MSIVEVVVNEPSIEVISDVVTTIEIVSGETNIEVLNIGTQGPPGIQGATGPQGIQGATGPSGADGADGQGVPVGGTTGQALTKINGTDFNTQWTDITTTPPGSNKQIIYNDSGAFGADANLIWDKTADSLNVQTGFAGHPLHINSNTGVTIADVSTASASLILESIDSSPTGSATLIAEFPAPSGGSISQNTSGSGYSASGQTIEYRYSSVILADGVYYAPSSSDIISFTDTLNDTSDFSINLSLPATEADQTHWFIEKNVDGAGYNYSVIIPYNSSYEDVNFTSYTSPSSWPTYYSLSYTNPIAPTSQLYTDHGSYSGLTASGLTYDVEIDSYANINGVKYRSGTADVNSYTDNNSAATFGLQIDFTSGACDGYLIRISVDAGSTWSYHDIGGSVSYVYDGESNAPSDGTAETDWSRTIASFTGVQYAFKAFGKTASPSGNTVYASSANAYYATIINPSINYIVRHSFTGMPSGGAKVLADYNASVNSGKNITTDFLDVGYTSWGDGTAITPTSYGMSGTNQNIQVRLVGYSSSLAIFSATPLVISTTATGGSRYLSGSFSYPSGITTVKVSLNFNGAGYNFHREFTSPTSSFTYDLTSGSWGVSSLITPTASVPSTSRFDLNRTTLAQNSDNLLVISTGTGERFPSIGFGIANDTTSGHSVQARMCSESSSGSLRIGGASLKGYSSIAMSNQTYEFGQNNALNLQKSNSCHLTLWASDPNSPLAYFFSAGDSSRGTAYFGQNSTSFGTQSKVCIAPTAGGTTALLFRRTSGFSGDNITIDEAGSFRAGWGQSGRMYLNASSVSTTTQLLIGGTNTGSQLRLGQSDTSSASTEGDIWNSNTQKCLTVFTQGVRQFDTRTLFTQTANGTCANTVSETSISSTGIGTLVIPANFFVAGKTIKFSARGFYSTSGTPTLNLKFKFGSSVVVTTGTITAIAGSSSGFEFEGMITCRTTGGSGTVIGQGKAALLTSSASQNLPCVSTATTTVNTTSNQTVTATAQWGTASASNTISLTNFVMEVVA